MTQEFDTVLSRRGSGSIKWDFLPESSYDGEVIPMWVADMDFRTPPFVIEEIERSMSSGVLGYTGRTPRWSSAIVDWYRRRHSCGVSAEELLYIPGIVRGIAFAELCFTRPGDKVMVFSPVYHPFFLVTEKLGREVVRFSLDIDEDRNTYAIDFDRLSRQMAGCRMLVLSNPHNPGGRVWTEEELKRIADLATANGCLVVSDEIHGDMTSKAFTHHPFFTVSEAAASGSIVFASPSKAFNMPGLCSSYAIVRNPGIRKKFESFLDAGEFDSGNMFAANCCSACYEKGEEWLDSMLEYVYGNYMILKNFLEKELPSVKAFDMQASYLAFLDCRALGLPQKELTELFLDKAGLFLNDGSMFGNEGEGFMRMNLGCPSSVLEEALERLKNALKY